MPSENNIFGQNVGLQSYVEASGQMAKEANDYVNNLRRLYPELSTWSLENLQKFHESGQPISFNGKIIIPLTYNPSVSFINQDTKTEVQHELGSKAARALRDTNQAMEKAQTSIVSAIPFVYPLLATGANSYLNRHGIKNQYLPEAAVSTGLELTLPFLPALLKRGFNWGARNIGTKASRLAATMNQNISHNTINYDPITSTFAYRWEDGYGFRRYPYPVNTRFLFFERPSTLTFAERLGIPKGERNNLNKFSKDALFDLESYINSGQYRQMPVIDIQTGKVTWGSQKINEPFIKTLIRNGIDVKDPENIRLITGYTIIPRTFGTGVGYSSYKLFDKAPAPFNGRLGDAFMSPGASGYNKIMLTSPKTEAWNLMAENAQDETIKQVLISESSPRIDRSIMKDFWSNVQNATRPGNYLSGDEGTMPLGFDLIRMFKSRSPTSFKKDEYGNVIDSGISSWDDIVNKVLSKPRWKSRTNGLSTDSYLALLKQASREGSPYELRYSPDGFTEFNNQSIDNKFISDLLTQAKNGEIPKEKFLEEFHKWVEPYGGMDAKIVNDEIVIPHPFLYKRKKGGLLIPKAKSGIHIKKKNRGKFTKSAKQAGQSVQEHARSVLNDPNATPLQRKRANFARNAAKWNKK